MVLHFPLSVETLASVHLFEAEYPAFCSWRDSLPVEEQMELAYFGARVIAISFADTQPLPVIKSAKQGTTPAASSASAQKPRRKQVVK